MDQRREIRDWQREIRDWQREIVSCEWQATHHETVGWDVQDRPLVIPPPASSSEGDTISAAVAWGVGTVTYNNHRIEPRIGRG